MKALLPLLLVLLAFGAPAGAETIAIPIHNGGAYADGLEGYNIFEGKAGGVRLSDQRVVDDSFNDSSLDSVNFGYETAGGGTVVENNSYLEVKSTAASLAAMVWDKNTVSSSSPVAIEIWCDLIALSGSPYLFGWFKQDGTPAINMSTDNARVWITPVGLYSVRIQYKNSAGTIYYWVPASTTGASGWSTSYTNIYLPDGYNRLYFFSDGTYWRMVLYSEDTNVHVGTSWVAWANTWDPSGSNEWIVMGDQSTSAVYTTLRFNRYRRWASSTMFKAVTTSPATTGAWTPLPQGIIDMSTARLVVLKNGVVQAETDTSVKCQYAANGGALNGTWLTLSALRAVSDITVTDTTNSLKLTCQFNSNGSDAVEAEYAMQFEFTPTGGGGASTGNVNSGFNEPLGVRRMF